MSQYDDYDYDDYSYDSTDYYDVGRSARRRTSGGSRPPKKPIYKKWWFWLIIVLVLGGIGNAVNGGDTSSDVTVSEPMEASVPEDTANPDDVFGFNITFYNSFRNDVTGRWRSALVSTAAHIEDYALDYYNAYFESDDEVHFIYNLGLGTENCLTVGSGVLYVTVREYVDGEEHDAKEAGTGMLLGKYQISMDTGEVESIPLD